MPLIHNSSAPLSKEAVRQITECPAARFSAKLNGATTEKPFFFSDITVTTDNLLDNTLLPIIHVKRNDSESE